MTESGPPYVMSYPAPRACPFDPPPEYGRLRAEKPVSKVRLADGREAWLVTRYDDARMVFSDPRFSSDRRHPNFPARIQGRATINKAPPIIVGLDGKEHAEARRAVISEFTAKRAQALRPRIQEMTDECVDAMLAGDRPVDLVAALAMPVPSLVICEQLGVPYADHAFFQELTVKLVSPRTTEDEREAATGELRTYLAEIIAARERSPGDDLLSRQILKQRMAGVAGRDGLVSLAWLLLVAGHETTAGMISLGVLALLENPGQLAMIRDDPATTPAAVEELLRYFSNVQHVTARIATQDMEIRGALVRTGDALIVSGLAADRDGAVFEDPDRLDLGRGARHHLAFGYGPHQCLGQHVARAELQIVLDTLFRRIPGLRLAVDFDDLRFRDDTNFYGLYEMPVTW